MSPLRLLLFSVVSVSFHIHTSLAQLRNITLGAQGVDDLDYFDPEFYNGNTTRIVGGRPINIVQVPWQVALYNYGSFICGGSIISVDWVLTAAHCVDGGGSFSVRAGSSDVRGGGQYRRAALVLYHGQYVAKTQNRDIALIRVSGKFKITSYVQPVALAKQGTRLPPRLFVSGWGRIRKNGPLPTHLRGVTIRRMPRSRCSKRYKRADIIITKYMICAEKRNKDSCQGDSGGPLVRRRIQYGIVSFGIGCAHPYYPGVYTNVRYLNEWIRSVIRHNGGRLPVFR